VDLVERRYFYGLCSINRSSNSSNVSIQFFLFFLKIVYNAMEKGDSKFEDVADLLPGNENVRIKVRVVRLWNIPAFINPSETNSQVCYSAFV
jgi:hypothetical protein